MKQSVMVCLAAKNLISMFRKMRLASSRQPRADFINVKILNVRKIMSRCFERNFDARCHFAFSKGSKVCRFDIQRITKTPLHVSGQQNFIFKR